MMHMKVNDHRLILITILILLCVRSCWASNYFAYIHGKEPMKSTGQPMSAFKSKLHRLCRLYVRGQKAQEKLIALDMDGIALGRRLEQPPQICRPIVVQMEAEEESR